MIINNHQLSSPALLDYSDLRGDPCRGANQEWYLDSWQRKAGCGPTTAATILSYLAQRHPALASLAHQGLRTADSFVAYMNTVWQHVTPTSMGLNCLSLFSGGSVSFARSRGCDLAFQEFPIGGIHDKGRPSLDRCRAFLSDALDKDLPVAFLNFSNGALKSVDSWHWVPLISMGETEDGHLLCTVLDEGQEKSVDFALWHQTTRLGGGLVALSPP